MHMQLIDSLFETKRMKKSAYLSVPYLRSSATLPTKLDAPLQIWLFNPSLLLTSGLLNKYAEQDPSVVHAAKVLFKLVAPTENVDLAK